MDEYFELIVKYKDTDYHFQVSPYKTVKELKSDIHFALSISPEKQRFRGFPAIFSETSQPQDTDTLNTLGIVDKNQSITLYENTTLNVSPDVFEK